ncbi:hypothetical protein AWJ20_5008 [Sugiyamaella lignohabitans]|uniref:Uncharacterized protein n=1 Tax=Sugiyamaella lignohabitans TaxID=796027 RepID=A0A167EGF3_9ASCO|nr:uncharacterized protein AWJ20_5008 [Sugiyamaella lignohabitans]ANB14052.1 hypothetical protein AWJ20_5008 [Sugiyamaella lignohabitans]
MGGLSIEDLEFFDKRNVLNSSKNDGFHLTPNVLEGDTKAPNDDDEDEGFGEFVEYDDAIKPQTKPDFHKPEIQDIYPDDVNISSMLSINNSYQNQPSVQKPHLQPDLLGLSDFVPSPTQTVESEVHISSPPKPQDPSSWDTPKTKTNSISIENEATQLSAFSSSMRFGQHLENKSGVTKVTEPTTLDQWNNILSALPGPSEPSTQQNKELRPEVKDTSLAPSNPSNKVAISRPLVPEKEQFQEEESLEVFDDFDEFSKASNIPSPNVLLAYFQTNVFASLNNFLNDLISISYLQKKRTIARPESKQFLSGFFEAVAIAGRIMTGRSRTAIDAAQLALADKESRELARIWKEELSVRLRSLLTTSMISDIPSLDARLTVSSKSVPGKEYCPICGLSRTELVKGSPRPEWDPNAKGHKSCLAFWDKRSTFGIE